MIRARLFVALALIVLAPTLSKAATEHQHPWPQLTGDARSPECRQALRLATAAFRSSQAALQGPFDPIPNLGSTFSVYRTRTDPTGGDELKSDGRTFDTVTRSGNQAPLFWQKTPKDGVRVAVLESRAGWRGDIYATYILPAAVTQADLLADAARADGGGAASHKALLGSARWNPPLVLTERTSGASWIIDSGEVYEALPDWQVFTPSVGALRSTCRIEFRPKMKNIASLLPAPVSRFAALLDEALGPGTDEGTLHPTVQLRNAVAAEWANAAVRPWAVVVGGYNTRKEVDNGLKAWAAGVRPRAVVYRAIREQYEPAEQAMATYYAQAFGLRPRQASAAGRFVIDALYRESFTFHRDDEAVKRAENPWPAGVR